MSRNHSAVRGALAGIVGGMVASWVMNEFMSRAGKTLQKVVQSDEQNFVDEVEQVVAANEPKEDATMKAADKVVSEVTGGRHLTWKGKQRGGPVVHYAFGALMGGVYGALAECAPSIAAGGGASFGTILFAGADLLAVPALGLSQSSTKEPVAKLASPLAAHIVYGVATDIVRRLLR
jgi:uncharacterized membrane protein YagU involved in acid resistance